MDIRNFFSPPRKRSVDEETVPDKAELEVLADTVDSHVKTHPEIIADPVTLCGTAEVTPSKVFDLGTLESGPAKPRNISFPTTVMNKQNRSFVRSWLDDYEWLEYSVSEDAAYCYPCRVMNAPKRQHDALVRGGLKNWANAKVTMKRHQGEKKQDIVTQFTTISSISYPKI